MNLGELHTELKNLLKRGSALDDQIPTMVRQSARMLERNWSFSYMEQWWEFTSNPLATDPRRIELPFPGLKAIKLFRWLGSTGLYYDLKRADPAEFGRRETMMPRAYWMSGHRAIILGSTPDEALDAELQVVALTSWPTADTGTHYLLEVADDLLIAQTMMRFMVGQKDDQRAISWKVLRDEALQSLISMDEEIKYSGSDLHMQYGGGTGVRNPP